MPLHSLELVLDGPSDAWVRADWTALVTAGLPSQARHRGASNAPHVTVASGPVITDGAVVAATALIGPLLPIEIELGGVVLLGRGPYALARLLTPERALLDAAEAVRGLVAAPHSPGWLAHLTLARRLRVDDVGAALAAVATGPAVPRSITVTGLRRWNPDDQETRLLAGIDAPIAGTATDESSPA